MFSHFCSSLFSFRQIVSPEAQFIVNIFKYLTVFAVFEKIKDPPEEHQQQLNIIKERVENNFRELSAVSERGKRVWAAD